MSYTAANVSLLQQMILLKDSALSVLSGPTTDGIVWPNLVADMLLRQVLASERYTKAIVVAFDRSADDLRLSLSSSGDGYNGGRDKLVVVEASGALCDLQTLDSVLAEVQAAVTAAARDSITAPESTNTANTEGGAQMAGDNSSSDNTPAVAVLVSSCSALELAVGSVRAMSFLRATMQMLSPAIAATAAGTDTGITAAADASLPAVRGVLLGVVHERLHSPWQLASTYRAAANAFCTCVPNEGQLSPGVALEVHTVRRTAAGRVQEAHELFSMPAERGMNVWVPAQLTALPQRKDWDGGSNDNNATETLATSGASEVETVFGDLGLTSAEEPMSADKLAADVAREKQASEDKRAQKQQQQQQQRLITFASTDPEFDEDSDPDADLDL